MSVDFWTFYVTEELKKDILSRLARAGGRLTQIAYKKMVPSHSDLLLFYYYHFITLNYDGYNLQGVYRFYKKNAESISATWNCRLKRKDLKQSLSRESPEQQVFHFSHLTL